MSPPVPRQRAFWVDIAKVEDWRVQFSAFMAALFTCSWRLVDAEEVTWGAAHRAKELADGLDGMLLQARQLGALSASPAVAAALREKLAESSVEHLHTPDCDGRPQPLRWRAVELAARPHVLIVDDSRMSARLLEMLLEELGTAHLAYDACSALQLAQRVKLDLVLLDLHLPDLHGCELARRLRSTAGAAGARMIVVSGSDSDADERAAFAAGVSAFVRKPVDGSSFRALVEEQLRQLQSARARERV